MFYNELTEEKVLTHPHDMHPTSGRKQHLNWQSAITPSVDTAVSNFAGALAEPEQLTVQDSWPTGGLHQWAKVILTYACRFEDVILAF